MAKFTDYVASLPAASAGVGTHLLVQGGAATKAYSARQVNFASFGGVGDGVTDNAAACTAFNSWATVQTEHICLIIPPGTYTME